MKKSVYTFLALVTLALGACRHKPHLVPDENQDLSAYPADSSQTTYLGARFNVYGYRAADQLIAEGDMAFPIVIPGIKAVADTFHLWPVIQDTIVVAYQIGNYPHRDSVETAISMWTKVLPLKFVPKTSADHNWVEFIKGSITSSNVGCIGGHQHIQIESYRFAGNIAHEIGHCLGLYHEQARSDRDQYVSITGSCRKQYAYERAAGRYTHVIDIGPYNYYSIMHYGPTRNCMQALDTKLPQGIPGQRDSVSTGDYRAIRQIYKL